MSIKLKMIIPMLVLVVIAAAAVLTTVVVLFSGYVETSSETSIQSFSNVVDDEFQQLHKRAELASRFIASNAEIASAVAAGDRAALLSEATVLVKSAGVEFCTIVDAQGNVIARAHEPDNFGDNIIGQANIASALSGQTLTTVEQGSAVKLSIRSGVPVYDGAGTLIGAVSSGYRLDTYTFVDEMKAITGIEVTVFLGDERLSTTIQNADGSRVVGTKAAENVSSKVLAGGDYYGKAVVVGRDAFVKYIPIKDHSGSVMGMLFVGQFTDQANATVAGFVLQGILVAAILLVIALPIVIMLARRTVRPINDMVQVAEKLADGDVDVHIDIQTKDEMSLLAKSFERMIEHTREQAVVIETIASGDMSVSIDVRSDRDVVGKALERMLDTNNKVFAQISETAAQVQNGASQISQGANSLAQGTTEQSAAVEQLSTSISQVADMAKANSELAGKAAELGDSIRNSARSGSEQMTRMTEAVNAINESSRAIEKVIKVIDDIAFQTNILALNAAVEAARAGQHGKGFAVVAEEVRNLAAKSAAAAKDTGSLITDSISKAEMGTEIASMTADSLVGIVSGIEQSSKLMGDIAHSSEEQRESIGHINTGINQVAQVVQQNSSASEQSAAASVEMSVRADAMQQLVMQFKLKDGLAGERTLGAAPQMKGIAPRAQEAEDYGKY